MSFSTKAFISSAFLASASGFSSIHPKMEHALSNIGIKSSQVSQGWGSAKASAGYHAPVGWVNGHKYSTCVDLRVSVGLTPQVKSRLVAAGFAPFFRVGGAWRGNEHVHCVYVGDLPLLPGPMQQVEDYIDGKDGLVGHKPLVGPLAPTIEERNTIREAFTTKVPHVAVDVITPASERLRCYAYLEPEGKSATVRCEVRAFVQHWGAVVLSEDEILFNNQVLSLASCNPRKSGAFLRADISGLSRLLGMAVADFYKSSDKAKAFVELRQGAS